MKKNDSIHFDGIAAHTRDRHVMTSRPGFRTDCAQGNQDGLDDDKITSASTSNWIFLIWCHAPDSKLFQLWIEKKNRNRFNLIDPSTPVSRRRCTKRLRIGLPKRSGLIGFCVCYFCIFHKGGQNPQIKWRFEKLQFRGRILHIPLPSWLDIL